MLVGVGDALDSSHKTPVIRITDIVNHPNADRLEIVKIGGYQVVVQKAQFKVGDLAVFVQPDSVLPVEDKFKFVWERDGGGELRVITPEMEIPERWRRVTARKFRKEWSEGLLMPLSDFFPPEGGYAFEGDDVSELLGITHYNPPEPNEESGTRISVKQSKVWPRSLKGWFYFLSYWLTFGLYDPWGDLGGTNEKAPPNTPPIYDVETYKNYSDAFADGETVVITEKIHGCNCRYVFVESLLGKGKMFAGSRKLWKRPKSSNIWRKILDQNPSIEAWCREHPGYVLYGEGVPCQKSARGGFEYTYGATKDKPKFYLFDIRTPEGEWLGYTDAHLMTQAYDITWVPEIAYGPFGAYQLDLAEGNSLVDKHTREGIVIRAVSDRHVHGLGRLQLKVVSNKYYELEKA